MTNNNMNNPALVSIIIPTYNCRKYIRQAIDSALSQTYKNIEIIVIDDGSTDNTREEIDDLISEKKISYIYQANKGLPGARNTGIKHSRGKYLVFLDSDDVILPEKIMCQIGFMKEHPDVCLVYSGYQYFKNDNLADLISPPLSKLRGNLYKELLRGCFFTVHSVLVKKACVEKVGCFDESFRASEDWDLYIRLAESGCQFDYIDKVLCLCRLRSDSMCLDWDRIFRSRKKLANKILMNSSRLTPDDRFALRYEDICKSWEMIYYQLRSTEGNGIPDDLHDTIKATRNLYDPMMEKDAIIKNQDARIMNMTSSIRWKITSPLRIALNIVKKLKRSVGEQNRYKSQ
ncbi:MAG: glycosyltransferase [Nitrospirae bacterium]|nr:glycosyltransferase [Nitrospirota bacterium]